MGGDEFGSSVGLNGYTLVVGAHKSDIDGEDSGTAIVFERQGDAWEQAAVLVANEYTVGYNFGRSVGIDGDLILVGAVFGDGNEPGSGCAFLFERINEQWTEIAKLIADDGEAGDSFGRAVAIDGRIALVGAHHDDDQGNDSGAVYVFAQ